jgi:hypothetical protein
LYLWIKYQRWNKNRALLSFLFKMLGDIFAGRKFFLLWRKTSAPTGSSTLENRASTVPGYFDWLKPIAAPVIGSG